MTTSATDLYGRDHAVEYRGMVGRARVKGTRCLPNDVPEVWFSFDASDGTRVLSSEYLSVEAFRKLIRDA